MTAKPKPMLAFGVYDTTTGKLSQVKTDLSSARGAASLRYAGSAYRVERVRVVPVKGRGK